MLATGWAGIVAEFFHCYCFSMKESFSDNISNFFFQPSSDGHPGAHIDFAKKRLQLAESLFYKVLENILLSERRRLSGNGKSGFQVLKIHMCGLVMPNNCFFFQSAVYWKNCLNIIQAN